jgi:hypothetical protein
MSSPVPITMSPEEMIFTFKQRSEESFKEAWSRISDSYGKTKPKMTLGLLLSSFYFGLILCYRYALDAVAGGDFLHCDGDQAFNVIKKLIAIYSSPSKFDSSLVSIYARLDTLETNSTCSALPFEKGRTPVLSATPWITDSTTVQNIVIIAIVSKVQRKSSYISLNLTDTQQKA